VLNHVQRCTAQPGHEMYDDPMSANEELDWDDLRYLLCAVRAQTLAGAARVMGVEHTTIGRRLTALERSLGAPVVLRGPEGLRLTPYGEKLTPLVEDVERAVSAVRDLAASQKGRVRLAVPSGFTRLFTGGLAQLCLDNPGLSLELVSGSRPVDLKRGEADLAIRSGPVVDNELVTRKLCESGFSLYASEVYLASRSAPRDLDDLTGHDVIAYDPSLASVPAAKWIEQRSANATIVLRSREMTDMLAAASSGVGLAVLPCMLGDAESALRRLTPAVLATRPLSLIYRREAKLSKQVRAVIDFVVGVMREHAEQIGG
jgi:DNA-binding transcriptional LysR family regulator